MAGRTVTVTLGANVAGFIAGMGRAAASVDNVVGKMARSAADNTEQWNRVGSTLTRIGAVAAVGLGAAAKAAMDWESAFAGVKKTVDGSPEQIAALEGELRNMARTMATSHGEIAAVAEAAGALGVATEDVAGFTRTMIMLGETTNLTATEAADSLAQFMNVMGTAPDQVDNLGSALVALGNDGASTEREIVQMAQRIAGAGVQIGLTEAEVMGFASALSSVGVEVEAGGTAISSTMLKMEQAVRAGGAELDLLAQTAGVTSAEFKTAFEQDAAGAIQAFIEGLGRVQAAGGDVTGILRELGITGIREADALRRLASSGDLLAESMETARGAMEGGTALMDEYAQRAATTESQVRIAWNNIKDSAITAGQAMLPAIAGAARVVADLATAFGSLSPSAQAALVGATAVVAAVGLIGGGVIKAVVAIVELRAALATLGATSALTGLASSAALLATKLGLVAFAAYGVGRAFDAISNQGRSVEQAARAMESLGTNTQAAARDLSDFFRVTGTTGDFTLVADDITGVSDALTRLNNKSRWQEINDSLTGFKEGLGGSAGMATILEERFATMDQQLSRMATSGNLSSAQEAFRAMAEEAAKGGHDVGQLADRFPLLASALRDTAASMGVTNLSAQELAEWMGGKVPASVQAAAEGSQEAADALRAVGDAAGQVAMSIQDYANAMLALSGSQIGVESAIAAANDALKENGRNIDITTEAGRANVGALNQLAAASMQYVQTMADQGKSQEEQAAAIQRARGEYERLAQAMGFSADDARRMADAYFEAVAPSQQAAAAARQFAVDAASGSQAAGAMADALRGIPPTTEITITAPDMAPVTTTAEGLRQALEAIPPDKVITVTMPDGQVVTGTAAEIQAGLDRIASEKQINVTTPGASEAQANISTLAGMLDGLPEYKNVVVTMPNGEVAYTTAQRLAATIRDVPDNKQITLTLSNGETVTMTAGQARAAIESIPELRHTAINADASNAIDAARQAQAALNSVTNVGRIISVTSNAAATAAAAQGSMDGTRSVARIIAVTSNAAATAAAAQAAMNRTSSVSRIIAVTTNAASAAAAARAAVNSVQSRTVTITVRTVRVGDTGGGIPIATGGLVPAVSGLTGTAAHAGAQRLSAGGAVRGVSAHPRADNIPAWVTAGEVMMSNAAGDIYGRARLLALNSRRVDPGAFAAFMAAQGFADGGQIGKAKESFSMAPRLSSTVAGPGVAAGTVINRTVNQTNNTYYPVAERESTQVKRRAATAGVGVML